MTEATEIVRINSVSIEDNSRGSTVSVKAYGTTMQEAEDDAVASIMRLRVRLGRANKLSVAAEGLFELLKKMVDWPYATGEDFDHTVRTARDLIRAIEEEQVKP